MYLAVISHKPCWTDPSSPSGYATDGGFPFQMEALSELFDQTTLAVPVQSNSAPSGTNPLIGHNLEVRPLDHLQGLGWRRRLSLLGWMPRNLPRIWETIAQADAVHTPIPGDIGTLGILIVLMQRKPLFVRYCGIWGKVTRASHRFSFWLLQRIAGGRNVVLATGGGDEPPSAENPAIQWIFATSMRAAEMAAIPSRTPWQAGQPLKLITVARQEPSKNTDRLIKALGIVREHYPETTLDVVGDGSCLPALRQLAAELNLADAVTFHGKVNHDAVIAALSQAHLFCFPTDSEGFPKAVHEALACGLPVITTPVSVLPQLIGEGNGVLLSDIEPETIARAILNIVSDEERFAAMMRSAQCTARDYSLERWRDEIGQRLRAAWGPLSGERLARTQAGGPFREKSSLEEA